MVQRIPLKLKLIYKGSYQKSELLAPKYKSLNWICGTLEQIQYLWQSWYYWTQVALFAILQNRWFRQTHRGHAHLATNVNPLTWKVVFHYVAVSLFCFAKLRKFQIVQIWYPMLFLFLNVSKIVETKWYKTLTLKRLSSYSLFINY